MGRPETRYAWNGDVALAYQIVGEGPVDLVYLEGYASNVDVNWESPRYAQFLNGLANHARLIITDRRGYGCSDRFSPSDVPPLESIVDDLLAVMDAAGSERAVILATMFSGFVGALFAATRPQRTIGLVLYSAFATYSATDETPWMPTPEEWEVACEHIRADWGTPRWTVMTEDAERDWYVRWQRASVAPGAMIAETRAHWKTDIRPVLPSIHVPTLVIADVDGTRISAPDSDRFLAGRIAGAKLVELSGNDELPWYRGSARIVQEVGRFLADIREEEASFDRVLATVLFTDIVGSTSKAAELGDRAWKDLASRHHATIRALLARYRGKEMDTAGDGFLATFDGPARAIRCAQAIAEAVRPLGLEIRAGLHTGEVETIDGKVGGIAVHIGARVGALARPSQVLVSSTVKDLVAGSGLTFEDAGEHELKGVPDRWHLYRVVT